jgi:Ca2+-binding RTX toxin-like protein
VTDPTVNVTVPIDGLVVVPGVNLLPSELTNALQQIEIMPGAAGFLGEFSAKNTMLRGNGNHFQVFASVLADVTRLKDLAYGNDGIDGGSGNDSIFGDDGHITSVPETCLAVIDKEVAGQSVSLSDLLRDLSSLGFAKDALDTAPNAPVVSVTVGADWIVGGDGDDTIFGDTGTVVVPATALTVDGATLTAGALSRYNWLMDFQTIVADTSYTAHAAGEQVIADYGVKTGTTNATFVAGQSVLRPATHRLNIGNDYIRGGLGNDFVVGEHGVVVLPVVSAANSATLAGISTAELSAVNAALAAQDKTRTAALTAHISRDHAINANANKVGNWLFGNGLGYSLSVGNDQLYGDEGNDVLIGDVGLIEQPMLTIASTTSTTKAIADGLQNSFFKTIDRLYLGTLSAAQARAEAWGVQSTLAASNAADWSKNGSVSSWLLDTLDKRQAQRPAADYIVLDSDYADGGIGNDLVFGDMAAVIPIITDTTGAGMIQSMRVLPVGETAATLTATLRYVYNYGAYGPLHGVVTSDVNVRSSFLVDADWLIGNDGDDILYGLLGADYILGGNGNDQLSGGNGFDIVNGGTGTNIYAFDRTRDTVQAGGGTDVVRQSLDAGSSSLVLGSSWVSPLMTRLGANARTAAATLDPTGLASVRVGTAPALAAGISATPKVINTVAQALLRPTTDLNFIKGFDQTTLPGGDVVPFMRMALAPDAGDAGLFMAFAATAPMAKKSAAGPAELISGIRNGDIAIKGTTLAWTNWSDLIGGVDKVAVKVSDKTPYLDLDVLLFDAETGRFETHADADDDIAFH